MTLEGTTLQLRTHMPEDSAEEKMMSASLAFAETPAQVAMKGTRLAKILIVDNDEDVLVAMEHALEDEGYITATALSYEGASRLLSQDAFHILVLDDYLSDKDSLEVLAEWRRVGTVPPLVVVTYHQYPSKTNRTRFSLLGAGGFVNKRAPFELVETVRRLAYS